MSATVRSCDIEEMQGRWFFKTSYETSFGLVRYAAADLSHGLKYPSLKQFIAGLREVANTLEEDYEENKERLSEEEE